MRKLIYSMTVSLDGFIAGPDGEIDWSAPDEELHRFHNDHVRELGVHLLGRRLYETMVYWETARENPSLGEPELEFEEIWRALPKLVFSHSLTAVEGNAQLATRPLVEEVNALKLQPGKDIAVGGAGLASSLIELGLIDDFRLFVAPVVLGAGTPYFPASSHITDLRLIETRTFASRVVYLHYLRDGPRPAAEHSPSG
jgi:dihydrofolate reductase